METTQLKMTGLRPIHRAYLDLAAAMLIVGSSIVVGKIVAAEFPIFMALTIRFLIALPLLIWLSHQRGTLYIPPRPVLFQVFLQALTGVFLFNVLLLAGLRYTSATQSGLLASTTPAFIALLGVLLLHEKLSRFEWGGIALSVTGILVINLIGSTSAFSMDSRALLGNGLVLVAFVCEALFTIFRKASQEVPAILSATLVTAFGLILCLPIGLIEFLQFDMQAITLNQLLLLVYYGVFVSVVAYFLWFRGLENASTGAAGIVSGILPISAVVLSTLLLGEIFTLGHLIGLMLVLSAIGLMTFGPRFANHSTAS